MSLHGLLLALLAALLLGLLLRTGALVERVEVNLSEHVHLRRELLLALQCEDFALFLYGFRLCRLFGCCRLLCLRLCGLGLGFCFGLNLFRLSLLLFDNSCSIACGLCWLCRLLLSRRNRLFGLSLLALGLHRSGNRLFHLGLRLFCNGSLLWLFGRRRRFGGRLLAQAVEVNLSKGCIFLRLYASHSVVRPALLVAVRLAFLLLRMLEQQLLGLASHLLVRLESLNKCVILTVAELEAQFFLDLSKVTSFSQELNCGLESYIQFSYCFI